MIHLPTITHGPLQAYEVAELAELADDLEVWIEDLDEVPDHLSERIRCGRFAWPTPQAPSGEDPPRAADRRAHRSAATHAAALPTRRRP